MDSKKTQDGEWAGCHSNCVSRSECIVATLKRRCWGLKRKHGYLIGNTFVKCNCIWYRDSTADGTMTVLYTVYHSIIVLYYTLIKTVLNRQKQLMTAWVIVFSIRCLTKQWTLSICFGEIISERCCSIFSNFRNSWCLQPLLCEECCTVKKYKHMYCMTSPVHVFLVCSFFSLWSSFFTLVFLGAICQFFSAVAK